MAYPSSVSFQIVANRTAASAAEDWIRCCAFRLKELRPQSDSMSVATDLWPDVGAFDPMIAAEMEHEAWPVDD